MRKLSNNNIPNQIEYIAFDSNGNIIDLSLCSSISNINTTYPIKDKDTLRLETSKQYKEDNDNNDNKKYKINPNESNQDEDE